MNKMNAISKVYVICIYKKNIRIKSKICPRIIKVCTYKTIILTKDTMYNATLFSKYLSLNVISIIYL